MAEELREQVSSFCKKKLISAVNELGGKGKLQVTTLFLEEKKSSDQSEVWVNSKSIFCILA